MKKKFGLRFSILACLPTAVLYTLFYLIPLVMMIFTSFFKWDKIHMEGFIGFQNYIKLFSDPIFFTSLKNIAVWVFLALAVHIPFALLVALILNTKMRGWKFYRAALFIPQIISGVAWATIFISVYNPSYGLVNGVLGALGLDNLARNWLFDPKTAWPAIICTWIFFVGMYSMILLGDLLSIPEDVIEAAMIDGANKRQIAMKVQLPLLRLSICTCMVLTASGGIKYFDGLYLMTNGAPNFKTETLALYLYQQYGYAHFSYANTIGVALLVFGVALVFIIRKVMRSDESDY